MTNFEISEKIYNFILNRLKLIQQIKEPGKIRASSGRAVEELIDYLWELFATKYNNHLFESRIGHQDEINIFDDKGYCIKESVDRHCYIDNKIFCCFECKTYLDKCYLQRADSDFSLMGQKGNFHKILISLEDSINENTLAFFLNRNNIDKIFFLSTGKRNSKKEKRIYNQLDRIDINLITIFIEDIDDKIRNFLIIT